jgi:hypothetical protein
MIVIFEHGCQLVKGRILVAKRCFCTSPPEFAQDPLPRFASTIPVVLSVFMGLLQEQNSDCEPKKNNHGAEKIRK